MVSIWSSILACARQTYLDYVSKHIKDYLTQFDGNVLKTARHIGMAEPTLRYYIEQCNLLDHVIELRRKRRIGKEKEDV